MNKSEEKLNEVNPKGEVIGIVSRSNAIDNSVLLQAVQLWIINPKTKEVLMQKRTKNKDVDPGMIDICSGHVLSGESPIQAVLREANEELGILPENLMSKLKDLGKVEVDFSKVGRKGRYIAYEYIAFLDYPLDYYTKQDEEVDELFWMSYEDVKKAIQNGDQNMRIPYNEDTKRILDMIDKKIKELDRNNEER